LSVKKTCLEYNMINNVRIEGGGNTYIYKIKKENILNILEFILEKLE